MQQRVVTIVVVSLLVLAVAVSSALADSGKSFRAHLRGSAENPANASLAQGQAQFRLSADGETLSYFLNIANINNLTASHIHLGAPGANGPVVAFLFGSVPAGGGPSDGRLASGSISAANLVGPLAGQPLSALIAAMVAGNTYVNAHTNDGVAPTGTGPGDLPGGEIRGQILTAGN